MNNIFNLDGRIYDFRIRSRAEGGWNLYTSIFIAGTGEVESSALDSYSSIDDLLIGLRARLEAFSTKETIQINITNRGAKRDD